MNQLRPEDQILLLAAIVANSDDAIISHDLDGIVTSWNAGAERIFGFTAEETIGGPLFDISLTVSPIRDATGRITGASKIARDISERKQLEQALLRHAELTARSKA